jgi:hypothetical protein
MLKRVAASVVVVVVVVAAVATASQHAIPVAAFAVRFELVSSANAVTSAVVVLLVVTFAQQVVLLQHLFTQLAATAVALPLHLFTQHQ